MAELNSAEDQEAAVLPADEQAHEEAGEHADEQAALPDDVTDSEPVAAPEPPAAEPTPAEPPDLTMAEVSAAVRDLASSAGRYHDRAAQRESVIDYLRSELELLRRGERRGLLRPLLADLCRLRNDLARQADALPTDYTAEKASELLLSYAESVQLTLESNGVAAFAPDVGDAFDPRMHRKVKGEDTTDPALAGRIAGVRRDGYWDIEANSPITPAEVIVFAAVKGDVKGEQ